MVGKTDLGRQNTEPGPLMGTQCRDFQERKVDSEAQVQGPALPPTRWSPPGLLICLVDLSASPEDLLCAGPCARCWGSSNGQDSPCPCEAGLSGHKPDQKQMSKCVM